MDLAIYGAITGIIGTIIVVILFVFKCIEFRSEKPKLTIKVINDEPNVGGTKTGEVITEIKSFFKFLIKNKSKLPNSIISCKVFMRNCRDPNLNTELHRVKTEPLLPLIIPGKEPAKLIIKIEFHPNKKLEDLEKQYNLDIILLDQEDKNYLIKRTLMLPTFS